MASPGPVTPTERESAFAAGPPRFPRRLLIIGVSVLLAVGVGGALLEKLFSSVGLNPRVLPTNHAAPGVSLSKLRLAALPGGSALAHFLGTDPLATRRAPALALLDQHGARVTLASERGKVVVLSFFDAPCNDTCPVIGHELALADRLLGPAADHVALLTVNSDPKATTYSPAPAAFARTGLAGEANAAFLTGTVPALNPVWSSYGITIDVASTGTIAHSDYVYFIDPNGHLRYRITPPANESRRGTYSLSPALEVRVAQGIAAYAHALIATDVAGAHSPHHHH